MEGAKKLVMNSHNVFITGQAGTGKTVLLKEIRRELEHLQKRVAVTASTGIAASQYAAAMTLHRRAGISDGRYDLLTLVHLVSSLDHYETVCQRISSTDVLIIDEISMISARIFDQCEAVCQAVRQSEELFGGIQVVVAGDFLQLTPVPNRHLPDSEKWAFSSRAWNFHQVKLTEVLRQSEPQLIMAIHQLSHGHLSSETEKFVQDLARPLPQDSTLICGTRDEAMYFNLQKLKNMPGKEHLYKAIDIGKQCVLDTMVTAPKVLRLKVGVKVLLLKNISNELIYGLQGIVKELDAAGPTIHFPSLDITVKLDQQLFSVHGRNNSALAQRKQYPLTLSYAITAHKAQGMTLPWVTVDCRYMKHAGQIGVAVGRAMTSSGLQVLNFDRSHIKCPPEELLRHSAHVTREAVPDYSCCKLLESTIDVSLHDADEDSDFSDADDLTATELLELETVIAALEEQTEADAISVAEPSEMSALMTTQDSILQLLNSAATPGITDLEKEMNGL